MEKRELKRKGKWTSQEDDKLRHYVNVHGGPHHWDTMARNLDIGRSANSCRLRWVNYLSPSVRRGNITHEEMIVILQLHSQLGNQWSKIALKLSGRTDNDIKNFWNTRMKKEAKRLNCDVESEEFRKIMTTRLRATVPPPTPISSGCGSCTTTTLVASSSTGPTIENPIIGVVECCEDPPSFRTWL